MNIRDAIIKIERERDYLGAACIIIEEIIREKDLKISKRKKDRKTMELAKILEERHDKLRTIDSGLRPNEIVDKVCTEGVMDAMELLHLPNEDVNLSEWLKDD